MKLVLLRPAAVLLGVFSLLTGVLYPVVVTGLAQLVFPHESKGSLVSQGGEIKGSALIGQPFESAGYFKARPSATAEYPYNGAASGATNLGPMNPNFLAGLREHVQSEMQTNRSAEKVPVDLVTASASGLDPHISPRSARYQVERVARARGLEVDKVRGLVERYTELRTFGIFGEPRVNVVALNIALDSLSN